MADDHWADRMDRLGRAVWELFHAHPEIEYVRAEVILDGDSEVLATDVVGGVLWIDEAGDDNRQVILPEGEPARAGRREEPRAPD